MVVEIIRWVSLALLWLVMGLNVCTLIRGHRLNKRLKEACTTMDKLIFEHIRKHGKHITLVETGNLCDRCQNGGDACHKPEGVECGRFLPMEGTTLTKIKGVVETQPEVGMDEFVDLFAEWMESKGWKSCMTFAPYEEEVSDGRNN